MAYFLKKCVKKGRVYLSIVNGYHDPKRGHAVQVTYKSFGTGSGLLEQGITDPVAYCEELVKKLNFEDNRKKCEEVTDRAPIKFGGHFLVNAVLNKLGVKDFIDILSLTTNYQFSLYDVFCALLFSRIIKPCSKYQTFNEVIPYLDKQYSFSYDQLLSGLSYFGDNYEKFVEIFTKLVHEKYKLDTYNAYFDCTNFYFEIDREDELRRKGPSKENRPLPLVGMGLLLDGNQIPIGLKLFPGNESEKSKIREIIEELRRSNDIKNRIVQVADKGLNCARNIHSAVKAGDGYIFSKSCKMLPETEKTWLFNPNDYRDIKDSEGNVLYRIKECIDDYYYSYEDNGTKTGFKVTEKRVVTYNPSLARKQLAEIEKLENKARELSLARAAKDEYGECSKYVSFKGRDGCKARSELNLKKLKEDKELCGFNLMVTSEIKLSDNDIYRIYHNLWRIEESFRIMKSELDARPVYLQKSSTIFGHFLICYIATLITRILQIYELNDEDSYQAIFKFIRDFQLAKCNGKYVNLLTKSDFLNKISELTKLPVKSALLTQKQYEKIMNYRFK